MKHNLTRNKPNGCNNELMLMNLLLEINIDGHGYNYGISSDNDSYDIVLPLN